MIKIENGIHYIYSKVRPDTIIHIAIPYIHEFLEHNTDARTDLISPKEILQLSFLQLKDQQSFRPHKHIEHLNVKGRKIAQESWVVLKGTVQCHYYDIDKSYIDYILVYEGGISITLYGGHTYTALERSLVYEFKTGPYLGQSDDKEFI